MSFSFRNIFSPDEGDIDGAPAGFAPPTGGADGELSRGGLQANPAASEVAGQDYLISELIAYIPPAISAQSGIPMSREVRIPLPADGSRDVKLSTIYQICPELFAAEITPLNDSTVTLPPKLGAMMGTGSAEGAAKNLADSLMGFSPASEKPLAGFSTPPANNVEAANPFWSPAPMAESKTPPAIPSDMKDETPRPRQDEPAAWPKESAVGLNPFAAQGPAAQGPAAQIPAKGNAFAAPAAPLAEAIIPAGFDAPAAAPAAGESAFSGGGIAEGFSESFAGFGSKPTSALFGGTSSPVTNEADDKSDKAFSGNPFESGQGFNTLFSKQAEVDLDIPFPTGPAPGPAAKSSEPVGEPQGVWGAMFHGGGFSNPDEVATEDNSFSPPALESIGNLLKQGASPAAAPAPAGFQSASESVATPASVFTPAPAPMTPTHAIPAGFSAFESAPESKEPAPAPASAPEVKEPVPAPKADFAAASGFPAFTAPTQGFAGFDTVPTPSPIDSFANGAAFEPPAPAAAPAPTLAPAAFEAPAVIAETAPAPVIAAPAPAREVVENVPTPRATAPATGEASFDMRDLELRAIFSTSENFTLSMVARRVVGLPGIVSCSLSTPGKLVQASKSEEGRIGNEAREMVATLRSLAKLTGLPEARNFTLHTDRGIVSLFLEGDCCVMVHHEAAAFEPGVREKLILVARSLINLEE
jgi:hypothetical protein